MKYENQSSTYLNVLDKYKINSVEENKLIAKSLMKGFATATFNLKGDLNLGSIIRNSLLCGANEHFILAHRQWDRRSAVGVHNYIPVHKHDEVTNAKEAYHLLCPLGYYPVIVEQGGHPMNIFYKFLRLNNLKPCFIFGPEEGFPEDWVPTVELQQTSVGRSFNVASAAAIILYEWSFGT